MNRRTLMTAAFLSSTGSLALAHGSAPQAKPPGKVKKEQKPWGIAGDARDVTRSVTASMTDDMRFSPERTEVNQDETVRFVLKNQGKLMHEFVIGARKDLEEHAAMMVKFQKMEHDEPYMSHVAPGKTGEIIWTFNRAGEFEFACLIAGHFQSGMVGKINVRRSGDDPSIMG